MIHTSVISEIEKQLEQLDPIIESFSSMQGLYLSKNQNAWPERSIIWGSEVSCLIQLYLDSESTANFTLRVCASEYRDGKHYCKQENLIKNSSLSSLKKSLEETLDESFNTVNNWVENKHTFDQVSGLDSLQVVQR